MSENQTQGIEKWMGYIAVMVATIAAFAALYEARMNREHQAISVWPYLEMWAGISLEEDDSEFDRFSFNIANKGVGPAIVENLTLKYKGKEYQSWYGLTVAIAKEKGLVGDLDLDEAGIGPGDVIEAGERRWVIKSSNSELAQIMANAIYGQEEITYSTCYCSLYKDCWELKFPKTRPQEVDICEIKD